MIISVTSQCFIYHSRHAPCMVHLRRGVYVRRRPTTANVDPQESSILGLGLIKLTTGRKVIHSIDFIVTRVTSQLWTCPFRSTLNTGYITALDMCEVCTEAVHSVALWTRVTSQLWTCEVCTEAVDWVALGTQVTSQLWTCVKYVPKQSIP